MKLPIIAANWKSHKTVDETVEWIRVFGQQDVGGRGEIIVCPPFTTLSVFQREVLSNNWNHIHLGAQNVSSQDVGPCTGEIAASMLAGLVEYAIVGHSERRRILRETDREITEKVKYLCKNGITPIVCVSDISDVGEWRAIPEAYNRTLVVAFEPLSSIGTGLADSPEHGAEVASAVKALLSPWQEVHFLYGGSVTPENVSTFVHQKGIDGVLIGGAGLNPMIFADVVRHAFS